MAPCAYCETPATETIPSDAGRVCRSHAIEFWTGLIAHVVARRDESKRCASSPAVEQPAGLEAQT